MQDSNTPIPSQTDLDETASIEALLSGEPEKAPETENSEAAAPEKEQDGGDETPEKEGLDYGMQVPITGGEPITLGELKDAYQNQQSTKLDLIERENAVFRDREQTTQLLSYLNELPQHVVEAIKGRAASDYQNQITLLHDTVPESRTVEGLAAMRDSLARLADEYGMPKGAIDQIRDAVTVKMMYDFARLKESIKAAKANVKPLRSESTKATPGAIGTKSELQGKIDRAHSTRSHADETSAVDALLRSNAA